MAPAARADMGDQEQAVGNQGQNSISLAFNEPLSWKPGKPISTHVLLGRLERLSEELADMDQDTADHASLNAIAPALGHRNLLSHKDRGVKAYATCCAVDIIRLCAPNAPFESSSLKLVFASLINYILPALQDPSHVYNEQHLYVIGSLADVQSVLLINEISDSDEWIARLFQACFDCVSSAKAPLQEHAVHNLTTIMSDIFRESAGLPINVIESMMAQFMRAAPPGGRARGEQDESQTTLLPKSEPVAYTMAKEICNEFSAKMSRYMGQYFSELVMEASKFALSNSHRDGGDGEAETDGHPSENDLKNLGQIHLLVRELWRSAPDVLQSVVPQMEAELNADDPHLRLIATEAFGDMIAGIGAAGPPPPPDLSPTRYPPLKLIDEMADSQPSGGNLLTNPRSPHSFAQAHPSAYQSFLARRNDRTAAIRASWTLAIGYILSTSAGGIGLSREEETDLVKALGEKLNDADEKVRLTAVKAIELLNFQDVVEKLGAQGGVENEGSVLASLADRCRDKRSAPRVAAMALLGRLWAAASGELADGNPHVTGCLSGAASRILNVFYTNDPELNVLLDRVLLECLVPISFPPPRRKGTKAGSAPAFDADTVRAERILLLVKCLDVPAKKVFFTLQSRQPQFASVVETYIKQCEAYNGGAMKSGEQKQIMARLDKTIDYWCLLLPDQAKVKSDLQKFAKLHDRRCYQLIRFAINAGNDYLTVSRAIKELFKRIKGASNGSLATIMDTIIPLVYRSSSLIFNRSHLPTIMAYYSRSDHGWTEMEPVAHEIIREISQHNPDLFKTYAGQLLKEISESAPTAKRPNEPQLFDALKAFSSFVSKNPDQATVDLAFAQKLNSFALYGKPPKAAKHAVSILMAAQDKASMVNATNLIEKVMAEWTLESPRLLNSLAAVSQLELLAPAITLEYDEQVRNLVVLQILQQTRTTTQNDAEADWVEDTAVSDELSAKLTALKLLVNRIRAVGSQGEAQDKAKAVVNLLRKCIIPPGELSKTGTTPRADKSRLRLLAAHLLLKLCTLKGLDEVLSPADFDQLAYVVQDAVPQVRVGFVDKLQKYLGRGRLRPRFYVIPYLTAFEPTTDLKVRVETWLRSAVQKLEQSNKTIMQGVMGRLLSLLAHHPDFRNEVPDLLDHAGYIMYFLNIVAAEDNLGLVYKYVERIKQTRDAITPEKSEDLYAVCDLAQAVIRTWQKRRNWSFRAYPGKVGLPVGLYLPLTSHDEAQKIAQTQYLPSGVEERLDEVLRNFDKKKKRRSIDERAEPPAKKVKNDGASRPGGALKKTAKSSKATRQSKKGLAASKGKEKLPSAGERRRSGRSTAKPRYIETDSEDDVDVSYNSDDEEELGEEEEGEEEGEDGEEEQDGESQGNENGNDRLKGDGKEGRKEDHSRIEIADSSSELEDLDDIEELSDPEEEDGKSKKNDKDEGAEEKGEKEEKGGAEEKPASRGTGTGKKASIPPKALPTRSARATRSTRSSRRIGGGAVAEAIMDEDEDEDDLIH